MPQPLIPIYLKKLKEVGISRDIPNISVENAQYICSLLAARKPKHILEIGTANGYSTLWWSQAMTTYCGNTDTVPSETNYIWAKDLLDTRWNSFDIWTLVSNSWYLIPDTYSITTIEQAWNMHCDAVEHFKNCKVKNIYAIWWDAKKVVHTLADTYYDCIYIDGMKKEYLQYLLSALPKCTLDAMIILDDVEKYADKMQDMYEYLHTHSIPYVLHHTDADDSIMVIYRKDISSI